MTHCNSNKCLQWVLVNGFLTCRFACARMQALLRFMLIVKSLGFWECSHVICLCMSLIYLIGLKQQRASFYTHCGTVKRPHFASMSVRYLIGRTPLRIMLCRFFKVVAKKSGSSRVFPVTASTCIRKSA